MWDIIWNIFFEVLLYRYKREHEEKAISRENIMKSHFPMEYMANVSGISLWSSHDISQKPWWLFRHLKVFRPSHCLGPNTFWLTNLHQKMPSLLPVLCCSPDCSDLPAGGLLLLNEEAENKMPNPRHQQMNQAASHS